MTKQLVKFMNERLQQEMDKLWESGELSNEIFAENAVRAFAHGL